MIKEKENSLRYMWHFCLGSCRKKCFPSTSHCKIFMCTMLSLYKAMIWFIRLVDLPILSCFSEAFSMTREIKNDLLNLQEYYFDSWGNKSFINKSHRRSTKQISEKIDRLSSCNWEVWTHKQGMSYVLLSYTNWGYRRIEGPKDN